METPCIFLSYQIPVSDVGQDGILRPIVNRPRTEFGIIYGPINNRPQVTNLPYIYLYVERAMSNSTAPLIFLESIFIGLSQQIGQPIKPPFPSGPAIVDPLLRH